MAYFEQDLYEAYKVTTAAVLIFRQNIFNKINMCINFCTTLREIKSQYGTGERR